MQTHMRGIVCLALSLAATLPARADTPAPAAAPAQEFKGKIEVTGAQGPRITAATLTTNKGETLALELDAAGDDLARVMFGQSVSITGTVSERDGKKWLTVEGFTDEKHTAAHELWRRSRCNACAVQNGALHSAEPQDLHGATAVAGRLYPGKQIFRSLARDGKYLWAATDDRIYQIDLAARTLVKTYDRTAGLDEQPLLELASDGTTLWILSRGAAAALTIGQDKVAPLPQVHGTFARLLVDGKAAWVIADNGTYRYTSPASPPETFPALPTGKRMAAEIHRGMWFPFWKENTAFYVAEPVSIGDKLFASSFGDIYELSGGAWKKLVAGGSEPQVRRGHLWALTAAGVAEVDPQAGSNTLHKADAFGDARLTGLLVSDDAVWVTSEPTAAPKSGQPPAGGVGRMALSDGRWQTWKTIDGLDSCHALVQAGEDGAVWVASRQGDYKVLAAHPGMTYVEKTLFTASHFGLHRWDAANAAWQTIPFAYTNVGQRYICGQDGQGSDGAIGPQTIERLCVGAGRIFAILHLMPQGTFSGFWPCVDQLAVRKAGGAWAADFAHHPEQLDLDGEQPLVLNISNKGEMILKAVGHDDVLDLFQTNDCCWAVTEGVVGWFDAAAGAWRKTAELGFNFYWRPTAVLDETNAVFVGTDRGLVSRLDLSTGQCEIIGGLQHRAIARIVRREGRLLVIGTEAPLGQLPARMPGCPALTDADAAAWDGKAWIAAPAAPPPSSPIPTWEFRPFKEAAKRGPYLREQFIGNLMWGPADGGATAPRYYVKEAYAPRPLGFGDEGQRMWLSTFTGLLKIDLPAKEHTR